MTTAREPWWSSGGDGDHLALDDPDAVLRAHRAARRGVTDTGRDTDRDPDPGVGADDGGGAGEAPAHLPDVCGVCPICLGMRLLAETRPELVAHLTEAARHLTAAARTLLDEGDGRRRHRAQPDDQLTRIDLD